MVATNCFDILIPNGVLSHTLAHLAVPYGGWQDARFEPEYIHNLVTDYQWPIIIHNRVQ
jgi:hypothetical protein